MKVLAPVCIDGSSDHDTQTGHELDDGRQDEPLSLLEAEELEQKDEEGDAGEDGGEDHGGLHRLHHRITFKRFRAGQLIDLGTVCAVGAHSPEVSREAVAYPPGIVNGRGSANQAYRYRRPRGGARYPIRPIVSRITIHWPSFYNVVTGKTLALPNLIALQHIPLSPAGVIAKRPAPIALPNSCAA